MGVINVSNPSETLTTYSIPTTRSATAVFTPSINDATGKGFLDKLGNVAAIGAAAAAVGLSAVGVVGCLFKKKITEVDTTSVRLDQK